MSDADEIKGVLDKYKNIDKKRIILIHTTLSNKISKVNLESIRFMKEKFLMQVAYGSHCEDYKSILISVGYLPESIFFYVKGDNNWVISRFLEDVFDKEQFVNDYFLYTDELISDLNKCLTTMIKGYHKMLVEDWHYVAPIGESVWDIWTDKAIEMNNLLDRYKKAETA